MTVIVAVFVPKFAAETFTLAVSVPLFDPDAGLTVNHGLLLLAVQVPLEVTVMDWSAGLAPPCVVVNVRLLGDRVKEAAVTVKVIPTVLVVLPLVTVRVAVLVPTAALLIFTLAVMVPFPEPDVGLTVNHVLLLLAVQVPSDVTVTDWLAGSLPP
jgi:hypothetical protein